MGHFEKSDIGRGLRPSAHMINEFNQELLNSSSNQTDTDFRSHLVFDQQPSFHVGNQGQVASLSLVGDPFDSVVNGTNFTGGPVTPIDATKQQSQQFGMPLGPDVMFQQNREVRSSFA